MLENTNTKQFYPGPIQNRTLEITKFLFRNPTQVKLTKTVKNEQGQNVDIRLTYGTDYEVQKILPDDINIEDANLTASTGKITLKDTVNIGVGEKLTAFRESALIQDADYPKNGNFPSASHEGALDYLTMQNQEQQEQIDRALKVPVSTTTVFNGQLPNLQPSKALKVNKDGTGFELSEYDPDEITTLTKQYMDAAEFAKDIAEAARDDAINYADTASGFADAAQTSASNAEIAENNAYQAYNSAATMVNNFNTTYTNAMQSLTESKTDALDSIAEAKTDALNALDSAINDITSTKETAIEDIDDVTQASKAAIIAEGNKQKQDITSLGEGYINTIAVDGTAAVTNITTAKNTALSSIDSDKSTALQAIASSEASTLDNITTAKTTALQSIITTGDTCVANVTAAGAAAQDNIAADLADAIDEINATKTGAIDDLINNAAGEALTRVEEVRDEAVSTINTAVDEAKAETATLITNTITTTNTIVSEATSDLNTVVSTAETTLDSSIEAAKKDLNSIVTNANTEIDTKITTVTNIETNVTAIQTVVENSANSAELSAELAQKYANNPVDVPVVEGEYSAKHYAQKAADVADTLENPMKNDLSNITETGVNKIKEIASTVTPDIDVSGLADTSLSNITDEGIEKIKEIANATEVLRMTLTAVHSDWSVTKAPYDSWGIQWIDGAYTYNTFNGVTVDVPDTETHDEVSASLIVEDEYNDEDMAYSCDFTSSGKVKPYVFSSQAIRSNFGSSANAAVYYVYVGNTAPTNSDNAYYANIPVLWIDTSGTQPVLKKYYINTGHATVLNDFTMFPICTLATLIGGPGYPGDDSSYTIDSTDMLNLNWLNIEIDEYVEVQCIIESYQNGSSWYDVYSDGKCVQGGQIASSQSGSITFLKKYKDNTYTLVGGCRAVLGTTVGTSVYLYNFAKTATGFNYYGNANTMTSWLAVGYLAESEY